MKRRRRLIEIAVAAVLSSVATLLVVNLGSGERRLTRPLAYRHTIESPEFLRTMSQLVGPPLVEGNLVVELLNGDQIFSAMLAALQGAQQSITFETYIYWSGTMGRRFTDVLVERARAGVRVHLMVDWFGSATVDEGLLDELRQAGVQVAEYRPVLWYSLGRFNNRTHRKLLIVDGRVGFTGGVGVGDHWLGNAESPEQWRDTQFRLEGPAVAQMQAAFMDNWLEVRGEVLDGEPYFPALLPVGAARAQVIRSSPVEGAETVRLALLLSIAAARRSVLIENSYFVPDELSISTLLDARRRGVDVQVIVPGPATDVKVVNKASRATWGRLLEAGVAIYEFMPTMLHCKVLIVDGAWVSVGSANFDSRSFRRDDEANLNVLDAAFGKRQVEVFEQDKARSRRVTLEGWRSRPLREKLKDRAASLLRAQL